MEEVGVGVNLSDLKLIHVTNDPMPKENKHYITLFMCATIPDDAQLLNLEPNKCEGWSEYSLEDLKKANSEGKLFGPLKHLVEAEEENEKFRKWLAD